MPALADRFPGACFQTGRALFAMHPALHTPSTRSANRRRRALRRQATLLEFRQLIPSRRYTELPHLKPSAFTDAIGTLGKLASNTAVALLTNALCVSMLACSLSLDAQPCPCIEGYQCCVTTQRCLPLGASCSADLSAEQDASGAIDDLGFDGVGVDAGSHDADTTTGPISLSGTAHGLFSLGTTVLATALDATGQSTEAQVSTRTRDDLGSFELELASRGLLRLQVSGFAYRGYNGTDAEEVELDSIGFVDDRRQQRVHVNILTHITYQRTLTLLREGRTFVDASDQAQRELVAVLPTTSPFYAPDKAFNQTQLLDQDGADGAYALLISTLFSLAATLSSSPLQSLIDRAQTDLADDGQIAEFMREQLEQAQATLHPDDIVAGLIGWLTERQTSAFVSDLHRLLDYDGDGVANRDDTCRYEANPAQDPAGCRRPLRQMILGVVFADFEGCLLFDSAEGIRCFKHVPDRSGVNALIDAGNVSYSIAGDFKTMATTSHALCAIRRSDDGLSCFALDGILQPEPSAIPVGGSFVDIIVADDFCGLRANGDVECFRFDGTGATTYVPHASATPKALLDSEEETRGSNIYCVTIVESGGVYCYYTTRTSGLASLRTIVDPPVADLHQLHFSYRDQGGCGLHPQSAEIICFGDTGGLNVPSGQFEQLSVGFDAFEESHPANAPNALCGISAQGHIACRNGHAGPQGRPASRIWVSQRSACALDSMNELHCWEL